jgi:glycosyltransferase involved in cell wall biosynthesis
VNIWYVHPYAGGPGVGRYWRPFSFANAWQKGGHKVRVVTASYHHLLEPNEPRKWYSKVRDVNYDFVPTTRYKGNGLSRVVSMCLFSLALIPWGLYTSLRSGRPDLIIYSSPHPYGFVSAWLLARLFRAKIFFEVRDLWPLSLVELGSVPPGHPLVKVTELIERFAYKSSDHVISLLPSADRHMYKKGLPTGRFTWVPNGADEMPAYEGKEHLAPLLTRLQQLRDSGKFIVVYAGAHGEPNALHVLIEAARVLSGAGNSHIHFVLVGRGERKESLSTLASSYGLDNVDFFDQVEKETAMQAMQCAHAGFLSLKPEPIFRFGVSPNKLWDYMLMALPVVYVCRAANNPVLEYDCGMSADPDDLQGVVDIIFKLSQLSSSELSNMGERGREAVLSSYLYGNLADKVLAILKSD